jgi:hypothetical protein
MSWEGSGVVATDAKNKNGISQQKKIDRIEGISLGEFVVQNAADIKKKSLRPGEGGNDGR